MKAKKTCSISNAFQLFAIKFFLESKPVGALVPRDFEKGNIDGLVLMELVCKLL